MMEQNWSETYSGKKLSSLLMKRVTGETIDTYSHANYKALSSVQIGLSKKKTPE